MQFKGSLGKAARSAAKASPNRVGEFLKPCGSRVQVSYVFLPVCASSHSKANKSWLVGDSQRHKNESLRSKQVNQLTWVRDSGESRDHRMDGDHCTVDCVEVLDGAAVIPSRLFDR